MDKEVLERLKGDAHSWDDVGNAGQEISYCHSEDLRALISAYEERGKVLEGLPEAILSASYGAPSSWPGKLPDGVTMKEWGRDYMKPSEAALHDNGVSDAYRAARAHLKEPGNGQG